MRWLQNKTSICQKTFPDISKQEFYKILRKNSFFYLKKNKIKIAF